MIQDTFPLDAGLSQLIALDIPYYYFTKQVLASVCCWFHSTWYTYSVHLFTHLSSFCMVQFKWNVIDSL